MLGKDRLRLLTSQCWLFLTVTHIRAGEVHSDFALIQVQHCTNPVLPSDCYVADLEDYIFLLLKVLQISVLRLMRGLFLL